MHLRIICRSTLICGCQLHFNLQTVPAWIQIYGGFNYLGLYNYVVDFFEDTPGHAAKKHAQELLTWWLKRALHLLTKNIWLTMTMIGKSSQMPPFIVDQMSQHLAKHSRNNVWPSSAWRMLELCSLSMIILHYMLSPRTLYIYWSPCNIMYIDQLPIEQCKLYT